LGVRAINTTPISSNSFSLEHRFYGQLNSAINFYRGSATTGGFITFATNNGTEAMRIAPNGSVGIGTANPQSLLSVEGTITSKQMTVTQTGWSDFVFDSAYQRMSLDKIAAYVHQNRHLPGIPSAAQIEQSGLDLAAMQKLQMQKIEDLTLYAIDADKRIKQQDTTIIQQQQLLLQLKQEVYQLKQQVNNQHKP